MKKAVGIHFGHDAGIAVVSERGIDLFLSKERLSRVKHAAGWDTGTLNAVLSANAGAVVGISVTQGEIDDKGTGIAVGPLGSFSITSDSPRFQAITHTMATAPRTGLLRWAENEPGLHFAFTINDDWPATLRQHTNLRYTRGLRNLRPDAYRPQDLPGYFDFNNDAEIGTGRCKVHANVVDEAFDGHFFMHHLAHAYYGFWASGLDAALVISQDGGHSETWDGGGYFWCSREHGVLPLAAGGFWMGHFYGRTGALMGLDTAGKLMGLAPYGEPKYFMEQLVGNIADVEGATGFEHSALCTAFLNTINNNDISALANWDRYAARPPQIVADIAASAQKIFEANMALYAETGMSLVKALGKTVDGIVLVGGAALNCPANTMLHQTMGTKIIVPPACNDEGLAIGNAIGAYFKAYGSFPPAPSDDYAKVYLGDQYSADALAAAVDGLEKVDDLNPATAARLLADGAIMGLFHGRSEIGPRALGHRSILASPLIGGNWKKVNAVKDREPWRPFAPICLEEDMAAHFSGSDLASRYMLFTHTVTHEGLPAITHADKSARAQAATQSCGPVYTILQAFKALTGFGVLMNTSFNGKGVPIVETPADAVAEAKRIGLDYFVCDLGIFRTK